MPSSLPFFTDAPLAVERVGYVINRIAVQRIDGDDGHLDAGDLFHAPAIGFQLRAGFGDQDFREVADVALGF